MTSAPRAGAEFEGAFVDELTRMLESEGCTGTQFTSFTSTQFTSSTSVTYICIHTQSHAVFISLYIYIYRCTCMYVFICMYVCMYVCMYISIMPAALEAFQ